MERAGVEGHRTIGVALIDLVRGALWPAVALGALYYFAAPMYGMLSSLSENLRAAQSIDLGYVKITVRETKIAPPEPDVGKVQTRQNSTRCVDRPFDGLRLPHLFYVEKLVRCREEASLRQIG